MSEEFRDIYEGYKNLVWSLILKRIPAQDAGEVFNITWIAVHGSLPSYRGLASRQAWIGRITCNCCADYWASRKKLEVLLPLGEDDSPERPPFVEWRTAFERASSREAVKKILEAVAELEPDYRFVIEKRIEGFRYREIAELYNELHGGAVDSNWVGKKIFEARERLADILGRQGVL